MRVFPVVRKVVQGAVAATNFVVRPIAGLQASTVAQGALGAPRAAAGIAASLTVPILRMGSACALSASQSVAGALGAAPSVAGQVAQLVGSVILPPDVPAVEVVQIRYDLTNRRGGATPVAAGSWNGANNAGLHDGAASGISNNGGVNSVSGSVTMDYPALSGKSALTITGAKLYVYWRLSGSTINSGTSGDVFFSRDGSTFTKVAGRAAGLGAGWDTLTTPDVADLKALGLVTSWADLQTVKARASGTIGGLQNCALVVDALELEVTATLTEAN